MCTYSVWNPASRAYDYFESDDTSSRAHVGAPPRALLSDRLGVAPERGGWPLPLGAKKVGSGMLPKGKIAMGDSMSIGGLPLSWIALGVGAYLLWRRAR